MTLMISRMVLRLTMKMVRIDEVHVVEWVTHHFGGVASVSEEKGHLRALKDFLVMFRIFR